MSHRVTDWRKARFLLAVLCTASKAFADSARDFNADTPGRSYTPYTVAEGYFQAESDTFHIIDMGSTQTIEALDPVFKYGLTSDLELELQTTGFFDVVSAEGGKTVRLSGFGDVVPELKWNIFGNDWQVFSAALKAGVKIPTAAPGIGNGAVEYYAILPTQLGLPADFTLQIQQEIDVLKNQNDTGKHFNYAEDIALSKTLGKVALSAELYAQSGTDARSQAQYTADAGLAYAVSPSTVISFGAYFGLNKYAPGIEAYTGFGFRF
jgi:hypothetical protein